MIDPCRSKYGANLAFGDDFRAEREHYDQRDELKNQHSIPDSLIPPAELLFDGASSTDEFKAVGEGFTSVYLIARAGLRPTDSVLDLGSGNGQKARVLASYLTTGTYDGLDIVRSGIEWCQNAYAGYPNFRFKLAAELYSSHYNLEGAVTADKYVLPYPAESFDLVFCASLFTHLMPRETENYLQQIARVLKPSGRLVATAFLLNADTLPTIEARTQDGLYSFKNIGTNHRYSDSQDPSMAVALPEVLFRDMIGRAGLRLCEITFGTWAQRRDILGALQDCVIAVK